MFHRVFHRFSGQWFRLLVYSGVVVAWVVAAPVWAVEGQVAPESRGAWDWTMIWTAVGAIAAVAAVAIPAFKARKKRDEEIDVLAARQEFQQQNSDEESLREYEEYKQRLIAAHDQSTLPSTTVIESFTVSLSGTYVSLRLSDTLRTEEMMEHSGRLREAEGDRYRSPREVLRLAFEEERRMLLVIGAPGSGKTTLMRHYLLSMLKDGNYGDFGFQPSTRIFFLALRELKKNEGASHESATFYKTVQQQLQSQEDGRRSDETITRWLQQGRTLVLFDGLDEIGNEQERIAACSWIDRQAGYWPNACFVVTSRPTGYRKGDGIELRTPLVRADIMGFSPEQQDEYLGKWFREFYVKRELRAEGCEASEWLGKQEVKAAEKTAAIIGFLNDTKNATLRKLAATPLLLQIMALLWKERDRLPESRAELYDGALHYLLGYRDESKGLRPLLSPLEARKVLAPLALWMQQEVKEDEAEKALMVERLQEELGVLNAPPSAENFFGYLVNRAGLFVRDGNTTRYRFSHKTFREYLAGFQMSADRPYEHLSRLVLHFGEDWWNEPLRFFLWQVDARVFDSFMKALFESPKSADLTQKEQDLLALLVAEAPRKKIDALKATLLDPETTLNRQRYLLDCLAMIASDEAIAAVHEFIDKGLARERDVLLRAGAITGKTLFNTVFQNLHEAGAQYLLIKGGSFIYSVTNSTESVPPFYMARYPVTNRLYRRFIVWLAGDASGISFSLDRFRQSLRDLAASYDNNGFTEYLNKTGDWADLMRSRYDDEARFNHDEQPVVGVSWYAATAYCLWLSMLGSGGKETTLYRLPRDIEWEFAAAGCEGREYPWGNDPPTKRHANFNQNEGATTPVGRYPDGATPEGLYDMAGNVWEWMGTRYDEEKSAVSLRGGSWLSLPGSLRCAARGLNNPGYYDFSIGFRVVCPSPVFENLKL